MSAEHVVTPAHAAALVEYVSFLRRKREGCVSEVAAEFKELREMRLFEDSYTKDDVESLLSGLLAVVRTTMKKDLQSTMHSSVLLLKQQFEQAEKAKISLDIDIPSTEDRNLLKAVEAWESNLTSGAGGQPQLRARATANLKPAGASLPSIGTTQDPKLLAELQDTSDANASLKDKFDKLTVHPHLNLNLNPHLNPRLHPHARTSVCAACPALTAHRSSAPTF